MMLTNYKIKEIKKYRLVMWLHLTIAIYRKLSTGNHSKQNNTQLQTWYNSAISVELKKLTKNKKNIMSNKGIWS